jgi:hypothetical protein
MEAGLEAPKYHAQDIEDENKRSKLLSDNPNALVKFHNVVARIDNPKQSCAFFSSLIHPIQYGLDHIYRLD